MRILEAKGLGDCYEATGRFMLDNPESTDYYLVHGMATGQEGSPIEGLKFGHSWLEKDGMVRDIANGKNFELPKQIYYLLGKIDENEVYRYTKKEVMEWIMKAEHWGPWELKAPR